MPPPKLARALRERHAAAPIDQAETIRHWPIGPDRHEQAMIHVRFALWVEGRGRISSVTQSRIYSILSFVMPDAAACENEPPPLPELERVAAAEATSTNHWSSGAVRNAAMALAPGKRPVLHRQANENR